MRARAYSKQTKVRRAMDHHFLAGFLPTLPDRRISMWQCSLAISLEVTKPSDNYRSRERKIKGRKPTPKTTHPNKKSLRKQFSGLFVQTVLPLSFKLNKRHAERVWANCLRKLVSAGFIGVGGFLGWVFLPLKKAHKLREEKGTQTQTFWSGYLRVGWGSST